MSRPVFWSRYFRENLSFDGSTSNFNAVMATLTPGQTLVKTIVRQDIALSMTIAPDTDVGLINPYGIHLDSSNVSPSIAPYPDPNPAGDAWIWWDVPFWRFEYYSAGSPNIWSARMGDKHRFWESKAQRTNSTSGNLYLWYQWDPSTYLNWVTAGMKAFGAVSLEALIMEAP